MRSLLVDGSYLIYRTMHVKDLSMLTDAKRRPTGAIHGFFRSLKAALTRFDPSLVVVAWDEDKSRYRTDLYPEYKAGRKKLDEDFRKSFFFQRKVIQKILPSLGVRQASVSGIEADDILWFLSRKDKFRPSIVMSDDKDLLQLVDEKVRVYRPIAGQVVTDRNFEEVAGIPQEKFVLMKALVGDTSDNVKGINGIGEKTALGFLEPMRDNSVDSLIKVAAQQKQSIRAQRIVEGRDLIERNLKIVDISHLPWESEQRRELREQITVPTQFNAKEAIGYFSRLRMNSVVNNFAAFASQFRRLR